jgi:hypothetical protein
MHRARPGLKDVLAEKMIDHTKLTRKTTIDPRLGLLNYPNIMLLNSCVGHACMHLEMKCCSLGSQRQR